MTPEQAVFLRDYFANLIESESKATVRVLEAVPDDRRDYRPDPKARTAWELAKHVATGDIWFLDSICEGAFDFDPESETRLTAGLNTVADVVEFYAREFPKRVEKLRSTPGEKLAQDVDFFGVLKQPAVMFLSIANNHAVHHRGQLATYLRPMGSKVPSIYGGSADEPT